MQRDLNFPCNLLYLSLLTSRAQTGLVSTRNDLHVSGLMDEFDRYLWGETRCREGSRLGPGSSNSDIHHSTRKSNAVVIDMVIALRVLVQGMSTASSRWMISFRRCIRSTHVLMFGSFRAPSPQILLRKLDVSVGAQLGLCRYCRWLYSLPLQGYALISLPAADRRIREPLPHINADFREVA